MGGVNMTRERDEFISGKRRTEAYIVGDCSGHENPDLWFPEGMGPGGKTDEQIKERAREVNTALAICNSCSKKDECLTEGMRPENIVHGIWGGMLAGERILNAGINYGDYSQWNPHTLALDFHRRVLPYLRSSV